MLCIKNSFIIKFIVNIFKCICFCYKNSKIKSIVDYIVCIAKSSVICNVSKKYINKNPLFVNSVIYHIIRKIIAGIDFIADKIHNFFAPIINKSNTKNEIDAFRNIPVGEKISYIGVFLAASAFGIVLAEFISVNFFNADRNYNLYVGIVFFVLGNILYFLGRNINIVFKSITFRFFKFLFELVKM